MTTDSELGVPREPIDGPDTDAWQEQFDLTAGPREPESTLLTIAMFGGLTVFTVGCYLLTGWG